MLLLPAGDSELAGHAYARFWPGHQLLAAHGWQETMVELKKPALQRHASLEFALAPIAVLLKAGQGVITLPAQ